MSLGNEMKKIMLAGIGAVAVTAEKSQQVIEMLVKKGEITVEQGKVLNEELRHNMKDIVNGAVPSKTDTLAQQLASMSEAEIADLKAKLAELEQDTE